MKQIDEEKLKTEIEKKIKSIESCPFIEAEFGATEKREGKIQAYKEILSSIDSLQQKESTEVDKLIQVKCLYPHDEHWEKDKVYVCHMWHHNSLNMDFWDVYYDYDNNPKYVQFTNINLLNKEFVIIQHEQKIKDVDLEKYFDAYLEKNNMYVSSDDGYVRCYNGDSLGSEGDYYRVAKHFFELGKNIKER